MNYSDEVESIAIIGMAALFLKQKIFKSFGLILKMVSMPLPTTQMKN